MKVLISFTHVSYLTYSNYPIWSP